MRSLQLLAAWAFALFLGTLASAQTTTPTLTTLYNFTGTPDGEYPEAGMVRGAGGVFYGSTCNGGDTNALGDGTVYSLTPPASGTSTWTETVIHKFNVQDGSCPNQITLGPAGILYGTTYQGGTANDGVVFSLAPPASAGGAWTETVLHNFQGSTDGYWPTAGVVIAHSGVIYGSTGSGGTSKSGIIYELTPPSSPGGAWTENILYSFTGGGDGDGPSGVIIGPGGVLYGTAASGGINYNGVVFSLTPPAAAGGPWTQTVLHSFTGPDGSDPQGGVALGSGGVLYGTTFLGPAPSAGTVFSLAPPGSSGAAWTESVLQFFTGTNGLNPSRPLMIGPGEVLYGTAGGGKPTGACRHGCGVAFSLAPPSSPGGSWAETIFDFGSAGYPPSSPLLFINGVLFGTTKKGGPYVCGLGGGCGTVFALKF